MNTFLSSDQEAIRDKYKSFAKEHVAPLVKGLETHSVCLKEFLTGLGQKGFLGVSVPREFGGQGLEFMFSVYFAEAVSAYEPGLGLSLANHYSVIEVLKKFGSQTQKSRYLPLLSRGEMLATLAFSEPEAGTDFRAVSSELSLSADGLVLSGRKSWVVNGEISQLALVLSRNLEGKKDTLALSLVDLTDTDKLEFSPDFARLGLRSAYVNQVLFKNQKLNPESILDSQAAADTITAFAFDTAKVVLAASATALTYSALEHALGHARSRQQFGSSIGQFQAVQWKLADLYSDLEGARLQVSRAAWSLEGEPENFARNAAMAKLLAARAAARHSGEALQIMGATGLMEDQPMEKFYRDAKAMEICLGSSEAQKLQLVDELKI